MAKIGYARVSTHEQNLDMQIDALTAAGCEKIFLEKVTGKKKERPELAKMMEYVRAGDTIVVWKLDRLGRSMRHLFELVDEFKEKEIGFQSLKESIDTTTATGKLIFAIFASLAEFERDMISERTLAGLVAARERGRKGGRPSKSEQFQQAKKLIGTGEFSMSEIAKMTGMSRTTLYDHLKKEQAAE